MKKTIIIVFAMACILAGCNQIDSLQKIDEGDCLVSFNLVGDITTSSTPMTKSSEDAIYLVQLYQGTSPFAMGIYDNPNFQFYLKKGAEKYRIVVSLIKKGDFPILVKGTERLVQISGSGVYGKYESLQIHSYTVSNENYFYIINQTTYNSVGLTYYYRNEAAYKVTGKPDTFLKFLKIDKAMLDSAYPMCDDWFYGEINDYSPIGEYETLNIDLKRVGFKLKYELSGVTDGDVTVKIYNSAKSFIDNTTSSATYSSAPQFYAFYEARNAWLYADDYTENFTLALSWKRDLGNGPVTVDYGTKTIQIKRNCLNNIKINLGSNDQNAVMNLTVESESTIGADAVTIPVQ